MSGWNGSSNRGCTAKPTQKIRGKGNSRGRVAACAILVCVGVIVAALLFFLNGRQGETVVAQKSHPINETNTVVKTKKQIETATHVVRPVTNKTESVQQKPKTPEEIEAEERAKDPFYDRHHIVAKVPLVKNPTEQLILSVFSTELGDMPPMIPQIPQVDEDTMRKTISKIDAAKEDDSDEVKHAKELVSAVKVELKKFLDDGGTVNGFLSYYVNQLDSAFQERNMCQQLFSKSLRQESPEAARELYQKFNERLEKKGIKPLRINTRQKSYLGIED